AMTHGGSIFISAKNQYIDKPIWGYDDVTEGDYVICSISDTGVGIPPDDMERIFEPFYTKKVMGRSGTGLGMAVVWGTVKDLKGYIDITSKVGEGTTFELYFPISRKKLTQEKNNLPITEYSGNKETILIVDDIDIQREVASGMLKLLNYNVRSVDSGEKAIEYIKNNKVDLIVLDMIMDPGINGLETYMRIKKISPDQKAIIASGFTNNKNVKEAQSLGAGSYIKKPYTLQKIGLAVQKELSRKK
ncbi:MAG: response regulator, partial [Candidatus Delongbacteria bacterium]|nr:response regulator [Candidatus Delongbacteria bacterium]